MRIITLNTWGGRAGKEGLLNFFKEHSATTDVFCLQEILSAPSEHLEDKPAGGVKLDNSKIMVYGLQEISDMLSEFSAYFRPHYGDNYGLLMLVRKNLGVIEEGEEFVYKERGYVHEEDLGNHARNIQYVKINYDNKLLTIINFHGLWNGKGKTDTDDRLLQSQKIIDFISKSAGETVLCGDFNLLPTTQSLKIIKDAGLRDLIAEYGITSTRTSHYTKPEKYADYIFVSPNLNVTDFKVLPDEVSDHSPLLIDFS